MFGTGLAYAMGAPGGGGGAGGSMMSFLPIILIFVGVKMVLPEPYRHYLPSWLSLIVIVGILSVAVILSILKARKDQKTNSEKPKEKSQ